MEKEEIQNVGGKSLLEEESIAPMLVSEVNDDDTRDDEHQNISQNEVGQVISDFPADASLRPTAFAKVEKSLASLGFFTPSSRRIKDQKVKRIGFTREIEGKRVEVTAEIHPSGVFGLPVTADQDKYLALQKIITNTLQSEGKITNPIRFKSAELLRLLNNSTKTGKNYKEVGEWLDVMSATTIISDGAVWVAGQKRFARDRFRVFDRAVSVGKELDDGTVADANYVWLSAWQLENINNRFLLPIDFETYQELKNHIAKALVPLLQVWLFATHKAGSFEKRYDELCEILALQGYRALSQILRQFKPSLDELTQHEYLEKWQIVKTTDKKAYKIIFFHGAKYHRDRRKRLEQKNRSDPPLVVAESEPIEPKLPELGKLDAAPATPAPSREKPGAAWREPRGAEGHLVDELASRGVTPSAALNLLGSLPPGRLDTVPDYIEYWETARKTGTVGPGFLYDLIKKGEPLPTHFETTKRRREREAAEDQRKNAARVEETLKARYENYCRQTVDRFIAEDLPAGEFEGRVAARKVEMMAEPGLLNDRPEMAEQFARLAIRAEIAKEVSLLAYEDYRRQELPRPKALEIDPAVRTTWNGISTAQNATNAPPLDDSMKEPVLPVTDQNSSPAPL